MTTRFVVLPGGTAGPYRAGRTKQKFNHKTKRHAITKQNFKENLFAVLKYFDTIM